MRLKNKRADSNLNQRCIAEFCNNRFFLFFVMTLVTEIILGQSDTLFLIEKKLSCKIIEIGETEIKYRLASSPNGPLYVTNKKNIIKYKLSNGFEEKVVIDTLPVGLLPKEFVGSRSVVKIQFSHLFVGCISVAYEKVVRKGINLEVEAGLTNNSFHRNETLKSFGTYSDVGAPFGYCFYLKPGIKLLLGKDFSKKRLKYTHPLKGRYIHFDLAISYVKLKDLFRYSTYDYWGNPTKIVTNVSSVAYGGFISYGRQFLLSRSFTFDYYFGLGYTLQTNVYSNPDFVERKVYDDRAKSISRYGGFARDRWIGYSVTAGVKIGYVIPSKKTVPLPKKIIAAK